MTVGELAKLYGLNRQSIYKRISKGDLSKGSDGKVDLAEAIRVFGEPSERNPSVTTLHSNELQKQTEVDNLKLQLEMLQKQLRKAEETEDFLKEQIRTKDESIHLLQTLLSAPQTKEPSQNEQIQSEVTEAITPKANNNSDLPVKESNSDEPKARRRGLLGRVLGTILDN